MKQTTIKNLEKEFRKNRKKTILMGIFVLILLIIALSRIIFLMQIETAFSRKTEETSEEILTPVDIDGSTFYAPNEYFLNIFYSNMYIAFGKIFWYLIMGPIILSLLGITINNLITTIKLKKTVNEDHTKQKHHTKTSKQIKK